MDRTRQTFLILAALLSLSPACKKKDLSTAPTSDPTNPTPDLMMEKMHVQNYAQNGLAWDLRSPLARAFSKQKKMLAENLTVTLYSEAKPSTVITADKGTFNSAEPKPGDLSPSTFSVSGISLSPGDMFLEGHVVAISTEGHKLITDWAHYERSLGLIVSSAPVQVIRHDSITKGIGLEATADLSQIKIFNQTVVIKEKPE